MTTIDWGSFTIQTDSHPAPPAYSNPGLAVNNGSMWLASNVQVLANGNLELSLQQNSGQTWDNNGQQEEIWAASEAVFQNTVNYGTYCCTFKVTDGKGNLAWDQFSLSNAAPPQLNMNTTFGIFLYDHSTAGGSNAHSEIDFLELGYQNQANDGSGWIAGQPGGPTKNNGQFTLQPWDAASAGQPDWSILNRIAIDVSKIPSSGEVTILTKWTAGGAPVEFYLAYGAFDSKTFPFTDANTLSHTTPASVNSYVPAQSAGMKLHMNLWPYGGPSTAKPVFCEISHLEMPS